MKIVLDTNCLLPAVFPRSIYHWVWESFRHGTFTLCYTTEIIAEYEQLSQLCDNCSASVSEPVISLFEASGRRAVKGR